MKICHLPTDDCFSPLFSTLFFFLYHSNPPFTTVSDDHVHQLALFTAGAGYGAHFTVIFQPIAGEYDLIGKHPDSEHTIRNVSKYETAMLELRDLIGPELELIESRIAGPAKELQSVMKLIRKTITKRDHKVCDSDAFVVVG